MSKLATFIRTSDLFAAVRDLVFTCTVGFTFLSSIALIQVDQFEHTAPAWMGWVISAIGMTVVLGAAGLNSAANDCAKNFLFGVHGVVLLLSGTVAALGFFKVIHIGVFGCQLLVFALMTTVLPWALTLLLGVPMGIYAFFKAVGNRLFSAP